MRCYLPTANYPSPGGIPRGLLPKKKESPGQPCFSPSAPPHAPRLLVQVRQMMYHSSEPCDPADAVEFLLQASPSKEGPWADVQQYTAQCNGRWSLSPLFSVDTRFVRLQILRNNGYSGGARIPEVSFYQAEEPCAAAQK